jgi:PilZ domain
VLTPTAHMDALGVNLSEGGMCFFSVANLRVGSHVDIEFRPPQAEEPVRVSGKIRHRALYLYGIEFLSNNSDHGLKPEPNRAAAIQRSSS